MGNQHDPQQGSAADSGLRGIAPRAPYTHKIWYRPDSLESSAVHEGFGVNISESGLYIHTVDPPEVGSRFRVRFLLPQSKAEIDKDSSDTVEAIVQVVWVKNFDPINIDGILPGMGARFLSIESAARHSIRQFVRGSLGDQPAAESTDPMTVSSVATDAQPGSGEAASATTDDELRFEQSAALYIEGERQPLTGYTSKVSPTTIRFHADHIPEESVIHSIRPKSSTRGIRGVSALAVSVSRIRRTTTSSEKLVSLDLSFCEPTQRSYDKLAANLAQQSSKAARAEQSDDLNPIAGRSHRSSVAPLQSERPPTVDHTLISRLIDWSVVLVLAGVLLMAIQLASLA